MGGAAFSALATPVGGSALSNDAKVKIFNQLTFEGESLQSNGITGDELFRVLMKRHEDLSTLYGTESFTCPKVRFGRTGIMMPVLSIGGMRQQQTWSQGEIKDIKDINKEIQANFEAIADRAWRLGCNHFETARGYGTSELQYAPVIRKYPRESFILQTKVVPQKDAAKFRELLERSFTELGLTQESDYVDLFSFHGINKPCHLEWIIESNMEIVKEFQAAGKIRHVGFSTHGMAPFITQVIETGLFSYVNLHYQWVGSYTASGSGDEGGNAPALRAAKEQDMGVFIISPTDKGGALYEPPKALYRDCLPLTPIAFHNLWLWSHDDLIHTIVVGAARPSDLDEHLDALMKYDQRRELSHPVMMKLKKRVTDAMGEDFFDSWAKGLPDAYESPLGISVGYLYWLWWITKYWGMANFAQKRYASLEGNLKTWDDNKSEAENKEQFSWVPSLPFRPEQEDLIRAHLAEHGGAFFTPEKVDHIVAAMREVHSWLHTGGCLARNDLPPDVNVEDWKVAYNLQPDKPYPERG